MEIRNLNTFLQVASIKNFTQAGRNLGYSQSNISAQIQQLEQEVGAPLFNRIGRQVTLTQYGEELIPYAQKIVTTALHMENFLKSKEALSGTIHVGMVESLFEILFEQTINAYHDRYPHVKVDLVVDATETLKSNLEQGLLDFACVISDPLPKTKWHCAHSEAVPIVIVSNPENPLSKRAALRLKNLKESEFILMELTAPYILQFQSAIARQDMSIRPFLTLQSAHMARRLVENGPYLSVLPLYTVSQAVQAGHIALLNLTDFQHEEYVQTILHNNKVMTPQIEGFVEELHKTFTATIQT